jgi:addiction module HigA family antidote
MERLPNPHPGDVLREDFLEPLGMTAYRLAKSLRMTQSAVGEILAGKRGITPATALRLERFFGASAEFWLNLQAAYDLEEERRRDPARLAEVEALDLDARWQQHIRDRAERRQQTASLLAEERRRADPELAAIQPLEQPAAA